MQWSMKTLKVSLIASLIGTAVGLGSWVIGLGQIIWPAHPQMASSIKGDVKNIFLPPPEARYSSRRPAHSPLEDASLVSCPGVDFGCSISAVASSLVATTPISFETEQALRLYGVSRVGGGALSR
jgi:hypothetical protein